MYPCIQSYFNGNCNTQNNDNIVTDKSKKVTKLIKDVWSLTRHVFKSAIIIWMWKPCTDATNSNQCADFSIEASWVEYNSYNVRASNPNKSVAVVFYYACIVDWIVDYYMYVNSWKSVGTRPKDYVIMQWHHVVTVFLMGGSVLYGRFPVGIYILFIHEWTDIVVSILKILKTTESKTKYIVPWFVMNIVVWLSVRVLYFPRWVIYPLYMIVQSTFIKVLILFLVLLWCMHVYWFCLMLWMGISLLSKTPKQVSEMYDCDIHFKKKTIV